jgi:hypothetical protein
MPALALMTTVAVAMAGVTVARVARIPANTPWVGVRHAEAASEATVRTRPFDLAAARSVRVATPSVRVIGESRTLPLAPATLMVGLAAARSRTLASGSPRPLQSAPCEAAVTENFDADIAGMTGVPGRKMYYGRKTDAGIGSACRPPADAGTATP